MDFALANISLLYCNMLDLVTFLRLGTGLTILGFRSEAVKQLGSELFDDYDEIGDALFVNSTKSEEIK